MVLLNKTSLFFAQSAHTPRPVLAVLLSSVLLVACSEAEPPQATTEIQTGSSIASSQQTTDQGLVNQSPMLDVYKSPTCGCCKDWVTHMEGAEFSLTTHHPDNLAAVKDQYGVEPQYRSCHLGVSAEGYVFEGHVPARYVKQFLQQRPEGAIGLAVPGMPAGSPGMEVDNRFDPYRVLLLKKDGSYEVYAEVLSPADQ